MKRKLRKQFFLFLTLSIILLLPQKSFAGDKTLQSNDILYHDISYEEELAEAKAVLTLGDLSRVTSDLVLPASYGIHINIAWESSDESLIDTMGRVTTPTDADHTVTLTATLSSTKTDRTETVTFEARLPKTGTNEILAADAKTAQEYIDYLLNDGYVLPDSKELGIRSNISWSLIDGSAEIKDGKVLKTAQSAERQPIALKAVLTLDGQSEEFTCDHITLLDPYAGYILSYFAGKEESKEMYIGYSYDGVHWMRLNHADAVLTPRKGKKQIRDPFIMRKKDGSFAVFATNGWSSPMITIWDSENLETFENERLCKLAEKGGVASGIHTWAPECNYDPITDQYYVYWSDPDANGGIGQIYYNTSADLENFSTAGVFFEREFFVLDASIKKYKGDYYMVYADGTGDNDPENGGRRIYLAKADSLQPGTFYPCFGSLSEELAEGPFLLHNFRDNSWSAYYDYYSQHKFGVAKTTELSENQWTYEGINDFMPWEEVRHGGAIAVTEKELSRILETWGLDEPAIIDIAAPEAITAKTGTKLSALKLPKTVSATLSDGAIVDLPVTWKTGQDKLKKDNNCTIPGTIDSGTYENSSDPTVNITVTAVASPIMPIVLGIGAVLLLIIVLTLLLHRRKKGQKS